MTAIKNLAGIRIGQLLVLSRANNQVRDNGRTFSYWLCLCDCGAKIEVLSSNLNKAVQNNDKNRSCGCYHPSSPTKDRHKMPEYHSWSNMLQRCRNPDNQDFRFYGGRGIKVCERWADFGKFIEDMGPRPSPEQNTIERNNTNGNYEPGNCRWATRAEQGRNTRSNVVDEDTARQIRSLASHTRIKDLADRYGVSAACISHIKHGRTWKGI